MKGKFIAHINLMQVEAVLKEHQPYAALVVSTTGLDNNSFSEHSPTRVVLKEFEYDEELKSYKETISFDKMVKAPQSAIDKAIANADNYDVFANGGIDKDKYIAGADVLSVDDFQKEFSSVISALKEDGATLIINGDRKFAETYLGKIGCANGISELADNGKVVEQTRMTQEYFQKTGVVSKTATLEDLRNAIAPSTNGSFIGDAEKMRDFKELTKDDFLASYSYLTEAEYNATAKDVKAREEQGKIIGGDKRIAVINNFVTKYGRDENILVSEWQEQQKEAEAAIREDMSEKGKEKYKNADLDDKFKTLVEQGTLKPDDIEQGNSEFHKLISAIEDRGNKGVIIMHAASTGFENGKPPRSTGFPIQYTAIVYQRNANGKLDMSRRPSGISFNIEAPSKSFQNAIKNINDPKRPYDTFKETGIDLEDYKAKKGVFSADDATAKVNRLFKKYPIEDYAIIAIGGTKGSNYSFTQTCMSNLGNFAMCEAPYIDFAQAIKDYAYLAHTDDKYPNNAIFDEFAFTGKTFSVRDIAEIRSDSRPASTQEMCLETAKLIYLMENQQIELFRPEELVEKAQNAVESVEKVEKTVENSAPTLKSQSRVPDARSSDEETFIGDGYDNVEEPELSAEQLQIEEKVKNDAFSEMLGDEISGESQARNGSRSIFDPHPFKDDAENAMPQRGRTPRPSSPLFESNAVRRNSEELEKPERRFSRVSRQNTASSHPLSSPMGSAPRGARTIDPYDSERQINAPDRFPNRSVPVENNAEISRLLDIIEKQNAVILETNNRLTGVMEQITDRLMTVVERQDELTKFVVQTLADKTNVQEKGDVFRDPFQTASPELVNSSADVSSSTMESKLESAIAVIDEISRSVPTNRAQTHLMNAKQALNSAVGEIDRANREKGQRTAS